MNKIILIFCITFILNSCTQAQKTQQSTASKELAATEFAQAISNTADAVIVDVRTPEEFEKGHITNALNLNWYGSEFDKQVATLDKTKPVFVYCLTGARSSSATDRMRKAGFENIIEMPGGMMDWRANSLPEATTKSGGKGMSLAQYEALINTDKLVLVDFYADWCAPCKKMKPYLEKIAVDMADKVTLVRIDADEHIELCKELRVSALPVLKLYKNNKLIWQNEGFIDEQAVRQQLK